MFIPLASASCWVQFLLTNTPVEYRRDEINPLGVGITLVLRRSECYSRATLIFVFVFVVMIFFLTFGSSTVELRPPLVVQ